MARNKLQQADAETAYWYIQPKFATREDAEAACQLLDGLCDNKPLVHEKKVTSYKDTIAGQFILEVFKVPNRSYHTEDVQAHLEECHHSASTASSYLPQLVKEGVLYRVGPQTYAKRNVPNDPAPAVRPNVDLDASIDGEPPGLELGKADSCGCGDEGHSHQDPGHRG